MKSLSLGSGLLSKLSIAVASCLLSSVVAHAQTLYFDPNHTGSAAGGSGEFNGVDNFETGGVNQTFTTDADVVFDGAVGTVTVDAPVSADSLEVGVTSGTEVIGSGADASTITFPATQYHTVIQADTGSENVVFNSGINESITAPNYNNSYVQSNTTGNITFNGGISFTNNTGDGGDGSLTGEPGFVLNANVAGGTFTLNSAVSNSGVGGNEPSLDYYGSNTGNSLTLTSAASFSGALINIGAGSVVYDQGASFSNGAFISNYGSYLTDTDGLNVSATIQNNGGQLIVGDALADDTTFSGTITAYNEGTPTLDVVAGGVVHFTNNIGNNSNGGEMIKEGAGIASMEDSNENFAGNVDIQNGTLVAAVQTSVSGATVTIENVASGSVNANQTLATLAGTGGVTANVVALGINSVIAPGGVNANGSRTAGTLTLANGLSAANGLTMEFTLTADPTTSSQIDLGATTATYALQLGGTINIDLSGTIDTSQIYTLAESSNTLQWNIGGSTNGLGNANFVVSGAPAGYEGLVFYEYNIAEQERQLNIGFEEIPEPSSYALMGFSLLSLVALRRLWQRVKA